jgi:choline dehydrogenase-like flavoprotein
MRRDFDVIISGAGEGVMLDEFTRAGIDVVALQRGQLRAYPKTPAAFQVMIAHAKWIMA